MHLVLGTANLGQKYGISNVNNLSNEESLELIKFAYSQGIRHFDTAPDYGVAESLLGRANISDLSSIQLKISKSAGTNIMDIKHSITTSLENIGAVSADTILFHDPEIYFSEEFSRIVDSLLDLGVAKRIGISCYTSEQASDAFDKCNKITAIQLPENILDRRLNESDSVRFLAESGCSIQIRSIFLQGLLLMKSTEVPKKLEITKPQISRLAEFAEGQGLTILQLCLSYVMQIPWAESIVFGANSINQLSEIFEASNKLIEMDWSEFEVIPEPWIDPRNW